MGCKSSTQIHTTDRNIFHGNLPSCTNKFCITRNMYCHTQYNNWITKSWDNIYIINQRTIFTNQSWGCAILYHKPRHCLSSPDQAKFSHSRLTIIYLFINTNFPIQLICHTWIACTDQSRYHTTSNPSLYSAFCI